MFSLTLETITTLSLVLAAMVDEYGPLESIDAGGRKDGGDGIVVQAVFADGTVIETFEVVKSKVTVLPDPPPGIPAGVTAH